MYRYSPITFRLFLMLLLLISGIFVSIYWLTVPMIKQNVFGLELHSNRQVLNIVYDLANRMYFSTESYVEQALDAEEQKLKAVVDLGESYIRTGLADSAEPPLDKNAHWQKLYAELRRLKFDGDNYLWISDFNGRLLSHPDDKFQGKNISDHIVAGEQSALPGIIQQVLKQGEGFYKYKWYRLQDTEVIDKYSYVRSFPEWDIVLGAGVYADDLYKEAGSSTFHVDLRIVPAGLAII